MVEKAPNCQPLETEDYGWDNFRYESKLFRMAHVERYGDGKIEVLHFTTFPHKDSPEPIFGFDVIAGKNKITGCFYDYSPGGDSEHPMLEQFADEAQRLEWNKTRKLPDWAERIFSRSMIAAGNVSDEAELAQIFDVARNGVDHYLEYVSETNNTAVSTKQAQNYYCENQKQNPHTPKVMVSLGLSEEDVKVFIHECLFPEIA
jgi:hypothetical protein